MLMIVTYGENMFNTNKFACDHTLKQHITTHNIFLSTSFEYNSVKFKLIIASYHVIVQALNILSYLLLTVLTCCLCLETLQVTVLLSASIKRDSDSTVCLMYGYNTQLRAIDCTQSTKGTVVIQLLVLGVVLFLGSDGKNALLI